MTSVKSFIVLMVVCFVAVVARPQRARRGWNSNTALGDLFNFGSRVNRNGNGGADVSSRRNIAGSLSTTSPTCRRRLRDDRQPEDGSDRIRRQSEDVHSRLLRPVDERLQLGQVKRSDCARVANMWST